MAFDRTPRARGRAWQQRRLRWLSRFPLCARCLAASPPRITAAEQVDHIVPLFKGGADNESNYQSLCRPCHVEKTAEDLRGVSARVAGYEDGGWPIPLADAVRARPIEESRDESDERQQRTDGR